MEFRHLRYFVAVAETLSFTRAATRLRVTQPTLSRQMADLEEAVGAALFRARGGPVALTAAGAHFLEGARRVLAEVEQLELSTRALAARLRIGYFGVFGSELVAGALRKFQRAKPHVGVELFDLPPGALAERLDDGTIDLALLGHVTSAQRQRFSVRAITRIPMLMALPAGHVEAKRRMLDLGRLRHDGFIGYTEREFPERTAMVSAVCRACGFEPRIVRRVDSFNSLLLAVGAGEGVGFAPAFIKTMPHVGVSFTRLKPPGFPLIFSAAWKRGASDPLLASFVDLLPELPAPPDVGAG